MSPTSKKEYFQWIAPRYRKASKKEKSLLLEEFCQVCGYHRKYAITKLRAFKKRYRKPPPRQKPGPKSQYQHPDFLKALKEIWIGTNLICSKRLKAAIPDWIGHYQQANGYLQPEILRKLIRISPSTIDHVLKPIRHLYRGKGRCTTKPGLLLKRHIPIKTNQWDESRPGFLETDTVAHCAVPPLRAITRSLPIQSTLPPTGASSALPTAKGFVILPTKSKISKNPYPSRFSVSIATMVENFSITSS